MPITDGTNETISNNQTATVNGNDTINSNNDTATSDGNATESSVPQFQIEQVFVSINDSFEFPKCLRQCSQFYVGRLDFEAVNETVEVWAGDIAEFRCKTGYYIDAPEPVRITWSPFMIFYNFVL